MSISRKTHVFDLAAKRISTLDMAGEGQQCVILISKLYPIHVVEDIAVRGTEPVEGVVPAWTDDFSVGGFVVSGELRQILKEYNWPVEDFSVGGFVVSGELRQILITYSNYPVDDFTVSGFVVGATLE